VTEVARESALGFADRLARRCTDALGDAALSAILHGSLTLGDFTPGRSDIDQRTVDPAASIGSDGVARILSRVRRELRRNDARCEAAPS
jgi:hypothetical protein